MNHNKRPKYTSYELGVMVKEKRQREGQNVAEFAAFYNVIEEIITQIETGGPYFSPKMYQICGQILELPEDELLAEIEDIIEQEESETVEIANRLFNELIMQKKISVH